MLRLNTTRQLARSFPRLARSMASESSAADDVCYHLKINISQL